jgi:hypothetical protein
VSQALVDAYLARRVLDHLLGIELSQLLWRKLPGATSAGAPRAARQCGAAPLRALLSGCKACERAKNVVRYPVCSGGTSARDDALRVARVAEEWRCAMAF